MNDNATLLFSAGALVMLGLLSKADFASLSNGAMMQSTYNGWPLYRYVGDRASGQATGDMAGGNWFAVRIPFTAPK